MFKSRWDPAERGGQSKFWENLLNWPECETRRDKLGRTWAVICTAMHVWEGTAASCRAAWHQMGSISKTQLRSLRRPSAEMLKRPSPPHTGLHQERVEARGPWDGC